MNKIFDDIRLIARNSVSQLQERIEESLEKLFEQVKQSEEKIQIKRQTKAPEPEPVKKPKIIEPKELKEKFPEKKVQKPDKPEKIERIEKIEKSEKSEKPEKTEKTEKTEKPEKQEKQEKVEKQSKPKQEKVKSSSEEILESDMDSLGLNSDESENSEESEVDIFTLPKTKENLLSVIKILDNPENNLEKVLDYLTSVIEGPDLDLKEPIKRLDFNKKFGKLSITPDQKQKIKKIWKLTKDQTTEEPNHIKDLEILKKKLEGAIGRKIDSEILGMFRRFEDKLKEKLGNKEASILDEVIKTLQNLIKNYKNSEIRKSASSLVEKLRGKLEGISKKR